MSHLLAISMIALQLSLAPPSPGEPGIRAVSIGSAGIAAPLSVEKTNPETARLRATIDSMIVMLEAGENRAFLERFVDPEFRESKGVDAILEEFEEEKAALLLSVLKEIRTKTPTYKERGTVATYKIKKRSDIPRHKINFVRIEGQWYLKNN